MEKLLVIVQIAFRNLFASRLKTFIVGGIVFGGALLVVVGSSFLESFIDGMSRSIIGAASGDIQVYSAKSKDDLAIWGQMGNDPDLATIDDFSKLNASMSKVPNVKSVVPMGISGALVAPGNSIDVALEKLRNTVRKQKDEAETNKPGTEVGGGQAPQPSSEIAADYQAEKSHVRHMIEVVASEHDNLKEIADAKSINPEDAPNLAKATSPGFWASFDKDPYDHLEFLENKISPLGTDADMLFLRYVGTDMDDFQKAFDRMEIVDGTRVPEGKRGFLFSKYTYEEFLKLKNARRLDKLKDFRDQRRRLFATDTEMQHMVKQNMTETKEIVLQLDDVKAREMAGRLQKELNSTETDLNKLLASFFNTNDANFDERYAFFYKEMAPMLDLYRIKVGDTLTIKAFTKTGYVRSVNIPVYGTFQFKGLGDTPLAGSLNLMDLMSFRELYGFVTEQSAAELAQLKKAAGAADVSRDQAEADLFGGGKDVVADATPGLIDENKEMDTSFIKKIREKDLVSRVWSRDEIQNGQVLNAAVFVNDPKNLDATMKAIEEQAKKDGMDVKAISWQKAAGFLGQFMLMMKLIFYTLVLIVFLVALVIINNALVMATLERVQEIGTLRAIGAHKPVIMLMLLIEAIAVGLVFGGSGALIGGLIVKAVAARGIPATSDVMTFFFSGPKFVPHLGVGNVIGSLIVVVIVSTFSSFYPAFMAIRISPLRAMQTEE